MKFLAPLTLNKFIHSVIDGVCLHHLEASLDVHRGLRMFQTSLHHVSLVTLGPQAAFVIMKSSGPFERGCWALL